MRLLKGSGPRFRPKVQASRHAANTDGDDPFWQSGGEFWLMRIDAGKARATLSRHTDSGMFDDS
jgi:hypothetical protein